MFKLWGLDREPAMLIGMDMLGVLERLVISYRRTMKWRMYDTVLHVIRVSCSADWLILPSGLTGCRYCVLEARMQPSSIAERRGVTTAVFSKNRSLPLNQPAVLRRAGR